MAKAIQCVKDNEEEIMIPSETEIFGYVSRCSEMDNMNEKQYIPSNIEGVPDLQNNTACCARYNM